MRTILQDIRFGLRMLLKNPGVTTLAVLALALGIGANTAVSSVAIAFLKKPVSFPHSERIVMIQGVAPGQTEFQTSISPADYFDIRRQARSFDSISAMQGTNVNLTGIGDPEKLHATYIPANFFEVLGELPILGRPFHPKEEEIGHEQVAILTHGLWMRRFSSDPQVVGKTIQIDGKAFTVVGVTSEDFDSFARTQIFLPLWFNDFEKSLRTSHYIDIVARLKTGVSLNDAQAEMFTILGRLQQQYPDAEKGWSIEVMPVDVWVSGELADQYCRILIAAVILVLLIACANVSNLLFARSASRQKEIAIRRALGAGRLRIIRQLLTESLLLAGAGAALGLLLGDWGIGVIRYYMPPEVEQFLPMWKHVGLESDVFLYTVAVALLAGIVSGLAPAFQSARTDIQGELKEFGRSNTEGARHQRLRSIFVVAEVSVSLILLIGAGLMTKGVRSLLLANPGLDPENVLTMRVSLPDAKYKTQELRAAFFGQALGELRSIPGVQSASVATQVPFGNGGDEQAIAIQGRPAEAGEYLPANIQRVSPDYFRMMNIPLRDGRLLSGTDGAQQPRVAVLSESLRRRYFASEIPLGKCVKIRPDGPNSQWTEIVGVVGDIKYDPYERQDVPVLYVPYTQSSDMLSYFSIRTKGDPSALAAAVRGKIAAVDPDQPIFEMMPLSRVISNRILGNSYVAVMLTALGAMALILSCVGVYGVMAYAVTERTHEIGVRLALGAHPRDVLRVIVGRGVILTLVGLLIGLPVAIGVAHFLASLLFGVTSSDLAIFGGATILMCAMTLPACYIPSRQAMQVDPINALRHE